MPARDGSVAVSGLVVIFGNDAVETIATVAIYHFINSDTPRFRQATRGP